MSLPLVAATRAASAPALGRFGHIFGGSSVMQDVYCRIDKVARTSATVLITGESGSGGELVARTVHERSECGRGPFVAVNCGAFPSDPIEAELFGYEKGPFTGAARMHRGCFERAEGAAKAFSKTAIATIRAHRWPGNVRELRNAVQRAFTLADAESTCAKATSGGAPKCWAPA